MSKETTKEKQMAVNKHHDGYKYDRTRIYDDDSSNMIVANNQPATHFMMQ